MRSPLAGVRRAGFAVAAGVALAIVAGVGVRGEGLLLERFGDYLESLRVQTGIPGMAATVVGTSDILWERGFGRQDMASSTAARPDTPFHFDGVTEMFTAAMVLRCVEEGRLALDDRVDKFKANSPDAGATLGQLMTHTSESPSGPIFSYRPERLEPIWPAVRACEGGSFRKTLSNLFEQLGMMDSVPGPDAPDLVPPAEGIPSNEAADRYRRALGRLATPYAVDSQGRATPTQYSATTLTPATGVVSTVRDVARFDLALKNGVIVRRDTLTAAWLPPVSGGRQLPHGYGWFVQTYNGVPVAWQFGAGDKGSSSLVITLPSRGLTLILAANSSGLVRPFPLASGDVAASPFGRLFLGLFAL